MKTYISVMATAVVFMLTGIRICAEENLLQNGGFEGAGSSCWTNTGTASCLMAQTWRHRTGDQAFAMGNDSGPEDAYGELSQEIELPVPTQRKKMCALTAWIMAEPYYTGRLMLKLECFNSDGETLAEKYRWFGGISASKWEREKIRGYAPWRTKTIRVSCVSSNMASGDGLSCIWLDDLSLSLK